MRGKSKHTKCQHEPVLLDTTAVLSIEYTRIALCVWLPTTIGAYFARVHSGIPLPFWHQSPPTKKRQKYGMAVVQLYYSRGTVELKPRLAVIRSQQDTHLTVPPQTGLPLAPVAAPWGAPWVLPIRQRIIPSSPPSSRPPHLWREWSNIGGSDTDYV